MSNLYFVTPGKIDLDHVFTFGVHAKETENPIGYFGTGLKFAIATLLRTGHDIHIHRGSECHRLRAIEMDFRGKQFKKIFLEEKDLGFTTDLGKNWEIWMAFRELESNTRDEKGFTTSDAKRIQSWKEENPESTIIVITGDGIMQAFHDIDMTFCNTRVIASTPELEVREGDSALIYYRGVRVGGTEKRGIFTYNLLAPVKLSEDRQLVGVHLPWRIGQALAKFTDEALLRRILTAPAPSFESEFDFHPSEPSAEFFEAFRKVSNTGKINQTARRIVMDHGKYAEADIELDEIQKQQLERACDFLKNLGYPVRKFPIKCVELHGHLGEARDATILISPACYRIGTKFLAATILEEYLHLKEGVRDETREMQNLLFDIIITMGEKIMGEPI